jgi:hypothetical protein
LNSQEVFYQLVCWYLQLQWVYVQI